MTEAAPQNPSLPNVRRIFIGSVAAVAVFGLIAAQWTRSIVEVEDDDVGVQWSSAIRRLGIEPIYPPQEDVSVGDLMLVVAHDRLDSESAPRFSAANSIRLWRLDLSDDLKRYYSYVPAFPNTKPRPSDRHAIWEQLDDSNSIFDTDSDRKNLPIVLFPEFSLARIRQTSHGFSTKDSLLSGFFGGGSSSEQTVELRVPAAETYGVPSIVASARLAQFCSDEKSKRFCSHAIARRHLASIAGVRIFDCLPVAQGNTKRVFRYEVQLVLISRVYTTRSIETLVSVGSELSERAGWTLSSEPDAKSETAKDKAADSPAQPADAPSAPRSLSQEQKAKLSQLVDQASGLSPGSNVSVSAAYGQRIAITKTLQRPVAIGFRAYRADLSKEDASCSDLR